MSGFVRDGLAGREGSMRTYAASALGYEQQRIALVLNVVTLIARETVGNRSLGGERARLGEC